MERRVFLAVLLSFVVLYSYQALLRAATAAATGEAAGVGVRARHAATARRSPRRRKRRDACGAAGTRRGESRCVGEQQPREITVETPTRTVVLTNRGGRVLHWRLKDYRDAHGAPVDLVPSGLPDAEPRPFSLQVDDAADHARLNSALYRVTRRRQRRRGRDDGSSDRSSSSSRTRTGWRRARSSGSSRRATSSRATISARQRTTHAEPDDPVGARALGDHGRHVGRRQLLHGQHVSAAAGDPAPRRRRSSAIPARRTSSRAPVHEGQFRFAGVDDHYFIAVAVTISTRRRASSRPLTLPGANDTQRQLLAHTLDAGRAGRRTSSFYVGPKQFDDAAGRWSRNSCGRSTSACSPGWWCRC